MKKKKKNPTDFGLRGRLIYQQISLETRKINLNLLRSQLKKKFLIHFNFADDMFHIDKTWQE